MRKYALYINVAAYGGETYNMILIEDIILNTFCDKVGDLKLNMKLGMLCTGV